MRIVQLGGNLLQKTINEIINFKQYEGVKWARFQELNRILKGFRQGELSVLSGRTGAGKTTFLCEYSLDLCQNGVTTLWGSFEMPLSKICKTLLHQYASEPLSNVPEHRVLHWAREFTSLPMYFMNLHGSQTEDAVFEIMNEAVCEYKIKHIIIDNLQFMLGTPSNEKRNLFEEKFARQDRFVGKLRSFATEKDIHLTLVAHPRKESVEISLNMSSLYGGGKLTQEADNVLLIQEEKDTSFPKKYLEIVKNRYDGQLGRMDLRFNRERKSFRHPHHREHFLEEPVSSRLATLE